MNGTMAKKRDKAKPAGAVNPWPERLRALRTRLKLTQPEAAARVRVSARTWFYWESGDRRPSAHAAYLIELLSEEKI